MQHNPPQSFREDIRMIGADETVNVSLAKLNAAGTALTINDDAVAATIDGTVAFSGLVTHTGGFKEQAAVVTGDTTVTTAMSGRTFIDTKGSATTTFTLPDAGTTAGYKYSFVCGDAGGEILVTPASGDKIVGKTHGAENGTGIAPAAGTGIKNTAATNVKGDFCTLVFDGVDTWWMTAVAGVWASQ